jgi:protein gp37
MGKETAIAWTDTTWNPWQGCPLRCPYCYMYREKKRYGQDPATVVRSKPPTFNLPRKLKDPARVFVCSWSDFFTPEADPWRADAWEIMRGAPHLTFQIPTKQPQRITECLPVGWPFPNVWLGVSIENATARHRLATLNSVEAAVYFASFEPLLSDVGNLGLGSMEHAGNILLDWAIVGGASGPGAQPCDLAWIRSIVAQCRAADVAVFCKQLGGFPDKRDRLEDFPEDLRIREFPVAVEGA